jgi:outer membrane protein OmpA-like peptidoglycan-associated protein
MFCHLSKSIVGLFFLAGLALTPAFIEAQTVPNTNSAKGYVAPKWDIFAGYSYLTPHASVTSTDGSTTTDYISVNLGGDFSYAYFFNRYVGAQAEVGLHEWGKQNGEEPVGTEGNNEGFTTLAGGVMLRYPTEHFAPFVHALVGSALVDGPAHSLYSWGPAVTVGGGLDYETSWWKHRIAIRVIQADYEFMRQNFADETLQDIFPPKTVGINASRISTGIVFHPGWTSFSPITLSCSANPDVAFPGDPVTVTLVAGNLNPKLNALYTWSAKNVNGSGVIATVSTGALVPGSYTVNCGVKEGKTGKEGLKPGESAESSTHFTLKPFEPPTIRCSANPATIKPGEKSTITAVGSSPQNRPLTYTYSTVAGTINGNATTAVFNSTGAPTGSVGITCKVTDDKEQSATADTSVTILPPPIAPVPHVKALCSLDFSRDKARPTRVDNEAKACLDEVALTLQREPDARAVIVGHQDIKESAAIAEKEKHAKASHRVDVQNFAAQRAVNTKAYLVSEKGIDASRINVASSETNGQIVENYLVPAGADFFAETPKTTAVDETAVKPIIRKPLEKKQAQKVHLKAKAETSK